MYVEHATARRTQLTMHAHDQLRATPPPSPARRPGPSGVRAGLAAAEEIQNRHADGHAARDLVEDHGAGAVGDGGIELDTPVDGTGVHDDGVGVAGGEAARVEAE